MSSIVFITNTLSKVATRSLNQSGERLADHTRKLSSGSRINKAGDDVASLSIAAKLETQVRGISKAQQNIMDNILKLEYAHSATISTMDNLQKMRELFVQGLNGTNSEDEKDALQREINGLLEAQFDLSLGQVNFDDFSDGFGYLITYGDDANGSAANYQTGYTDEDSLL